MSLKFQTAKWDVEITWEQLTVTPLDAAGSQRQGSVHPPTETTNSGAANFFLFDLIGQMFGPTQKQEQL